MTQNFTPELVQKHIASIEAAASAIDSVIESGISGDLIREAMGRHMRHIEIMCSMDHIKGSGVDLEPFAEAHSRGEAWLAAE